MLSLEIDGRWEPQDFIEVLGAIESFYYKLVQERLHRFRPPFWLDDEYLLFERERFGVLSFEAALDQLNARMLERARYETPSYRRLSVGRIQYASPGGIDLLGIGKIVETLANSIGRMKTYFDEAHLRSERDAQASLDTELKRIEIEKDRESLQALKIRNAQDALQLLDSHPDMHDALVPLLVRDQDAIVSRLAERKLISARVILGDQEKD
ncbi:hypothetical protein [Mesorhizobium loti]|uniref:hypothetical protein n=1 Tax=Rhizobium loti TaxID=381 RepID=UPI00047A7478|nr:hypothetical protein [Mesorhizobium loti]